MRLDQPQDDYAIINIITITITIIIIIKMRKLLLKVKLTTL